MLYLILIHPKVSTNMKYVFKCNLQQWFCSLHVLDTMNSLFRDQPQAKITTETLLLLLLVFQPELFYCFHGLQIFPSRVELRFI